LHKRVGVGPVRMKTRKHKESHITDLKLKQNDLVST